MPSEIRFVCPKCGQHFAAEAAWEGKALVCPACQAQFEVHSVAGPTANGPDPRLPLAARSHLGPEATDAGRPGLVREVGPTMLGFLTPPALAVVAGVWVLLLRSLPLGIGKHGGDTPGALLALLAGGVLMAFVTNRFSKWYRKSRGLYAFGIYRRACNAAFLLEPLIAVVIWLSLSDESAGLAIVPVAFGSYILSGVLAAVWLAGVKWAEGHW
jgi:hypothetical protein